MIAANAFHKSTYYSYNRNTRTVKMLGQTIQLLADGKWKLNDQNVEYIDGLEVILSALDVDIQAGLSDRIAKIYVTPQIAASLIFTGKITFERAYSAVLDTSTMQITFGEMVFGGVKGELIAISQAAIDSKFEATGCDVVTTNSQDQVVV